MWVVASAAFALYVANFSSYNKTYGALAGVIVFLVWLWISNIAVLLGAELNAEIERGRQIEGGHAVEGEPFLEPRDRRKLSSPAEPAEPRDQTRRTAAAISNRRRRRLSRRRPD